MMAILALVLASLFSYTSVQRYIFVEQRLEGQEVMEIGAALAKETMEIIANQDYGGNNANFPQNKVCRQFHGIGNPNCDIDDFNEMKELETDYDLGGEQFNFKVNVEVTWRNPDDVNQVVTGPTTVKAVTVSVQDDWGGSPLYMKAPHTLTRTFSQ